jgi:hypothetical protein
MDESFSEKQDRIATELQQLLTETYPTIDVSVGTVLFELLIRPAAYYFTKQDVELETVRNNYSIAQVLTSSDPDDTMVDNLLSNYNVTRRTGSSASGSISIYTNGNNNIYIPATATFTCSGLSITPLKSYVGVAGTTVYEDTDTVSYVPFVDLGDGRKVFSIQASTVEPLTSTLSAGLPCTSDVADSNISTIEIGSTFTGGSAEETNAQLLERARLGVNAKVLTGRDNIQQFLVSNEDLIVQDARVFGMGDALQTRDAVNNGGISSGGRVDAYIRTAVVPIAQDAPLTAYRQDDGSWELEVPASSFAGAYAVTQLTYGNQLINTSIQSTVGYSATGGWPLVESASQARYSKYQTLTIAFEADIGDPAASEAVFNARVLYMPGVAETQDFLNSEGIRSMTFDHVVKAVIPVVIEADISIGHRSGAAVPDITEFQQAVADVVNGKSIGIEALYTSDIAAACQQLFLDGTVKMPINLRATLYLPSGDIAYTGSQNYIKPPTDVGISFENCQFFCFPSDVNIAITEGV